MGARSNLIEDVLWEPGTIFYKISPSSIASASGSPNSQPPGAREYMETGTMCQSTGIDLSTIDPLSQILSALLDLDDIKG